MLGLLIIIQNVIGSLTCPIYRKMFFLYRTIFLNAGISINNYSILIAHNCSLWKIGSHFKNLFTYWATWGKFCALINISCYFPFFKVHGSSLSLVSSTSSLYSTVSIDIVEKSSACLCSCSLFMKISIVWDPEELELYCNKVRMFIFSFVLLHAILENNIFIFFCELLVTVWNHPVYILKAKKKVMV